MKSDNSRARRHAQCCQIRAFHAYFRLPDAELSDSVFLHLRKDDNLEACINSIKVASKVAPLLLILDNIYLAGSQILQLLARLIFTAGESFMLLVMTTNFGDHALGPVWRGAMMNAPLTTIDLSVLV